MTQRKPDRFERMVDKRSKTGMLDGLEMQEFFITESEAINLLRQEHKAVVRMVKKVEAWQCEQLAEDSDAIGVILDQLKRRAI